MQIEKERERATPRDNPPRTSGVSARLRRPAVRHPNVQASSLIVVLWVIGLLSVLVASFAFDAHVESRITSYYRKRAKAEQLARSGIEIAEMLMRKSSEIQKDKIEEGEEGDDWFEYAKRLSDGLPARGVEHALGDGLIRVEIVPEPSRRNINRLGRNDTEREQNLENILRVGDIPEEMWPELIESFLDWTDKDNVERADGAETDSHYATLEPPYKAKNGPLDTVGELLLVKGFTSTVVYGGQIDEDLDDPIMLSGIHDLLTTYGDGRVNVNAAPLRVLMTLPEVDEIVAGAIIEEREGMMEEGADQENNSFESVNDFFLRIPDLNRAQLSRLVTTGSTIYRITSTGDVSGVTKKVWCIVKYVDKGRNKGLTFLRWREED